MTEHDEANDHPAGQPQVDGQKPAAEVSGPAESPQEPQISGADYEFPEPQLGTAEISPETADRVELDKVAAEAAAVEREAERSTQLGAAEIIASVPAADVDFKVPPAEHDWDADEQTVLRTDFTKAPVATNPWTSQAKPGAAPEANQAKPTASVPEAAAARTAPVVPPAPQLPPTAAAAPARDDTQPPVLPPTAADDSGSFPTGPTAPKETAPQEATASGTPKIPAVDPENQSDAPAVEVAAPTEAAAPEAGPHRVGRGIDDGSGWRRPETPWAQPTTQWQQSATPWQPKANAWQSPGQLARGEADAAAAAEEAAKGAPPVEPGQVAQPEQPRQGKPWQSGQDAPPTHPGQPVGQSSQTSSQPSGPGLPATGRPGQVGQPPSGYPAQPSQSGLQSGQGGHPGQPPHNAGQPGIPGIPPAPGQQQYGQPPHNAGQPGGVAGGSPVQGNPAYGGPGAPGQPTFGAPGGPGGPGQTGYGQPWQQAPLPAGSGQQGGKGKLLIVLGVVLVGLILIGLLIWLIVGFVVGSNKADSPGPVAVTSASSSQDALKSAAGSEADIIVPQATPAEWLDGDCLRGFKGTEIKPADVVLCSSPHSAQVVASSEYGMTDSFPGDDAVKAKATQLCKGAPITDAAKKYNGLQVFQYFPTTNSWDNGDRQVQCIAVDPAGDNITTTLVQ